MSEPSAPIDALQERLGYRFRDPGLLVRALTHRSAAHDAQSYDAHGVLEDNERLEFLGDGVLYLVVSEYLFGVHPGASEGELTKRRRQLVQGAQQVVQGRALGLLEPGLLRWGHISEAEAQRGEAKMLEDAFEAVVGAIFLDGGYAEAVRVLTPWMASHDGVASPVVSSKSRLQEALQARGLPVPVYEVVHEEGPSHQPFFEVEARVVTEPGGVAEAWGSGRGRAKKVAEAEAATAALARLSGAGLIDGDPVD